MPVKTIIGIDPDVERSGFAIRYWLEQDKRFHWSLKTLTFFEVFDALETIDVDKVYIEAGWLNRGNWRVRVGNSSAANARIAEHVGENHQTGKLLAEMCKYLKIPFQLVRPNTRKKTHQEFKQLTGYNQRTNQEKRDAAMLLVGRP